jgi:hypothetical protein
MGSNPIPPAMKIANYKILFENSEVILLLDDSSGGITITNSAERLIEDLFSKYPNTKNKRIFYVDTDNNIDELVTDGYQFVFFKFGIKDLHLSLQKVFYNILDSL